MASEYQGDDAPATEEEEDRHDLSSHSDEAGGRGNAVLSVVKLVAASALFYSAGTSFAETYHHIKNPAVSSAASLANADPADLGMSVPSKYGYSAPTNDRRAHGRRLSDAKKNPPSYMKDLMEDLKARKKLMEDTPPEEVKYWFEYTGPLQKYFYRYSRSRKKADSFEGRDDSGVVNSRFIDKLGGGEEYSAFFSKKDLPNDEKEAHARLLDNCLSMGNERRPNRSKGTVWEELYKDSAAQDRCRVLFALNTVGAGRSTTILWETKPPAPHSAEPRPWISEQETAATHLERSLQEIDAMCATGLIAARVQVLVCEPIPGVWTDWMDSMLPHCGGKADPMTKEGQRDTKVEERASPIQVVVTANAKTADVCHDLKSGFMEQRMQDLVLSPPYLTDKEVDASKFDPVDKTTHPNLVSSDDHDLYVAMKWSTLVTVRGINAFLQASADLAIAASSKANQKPMAKDDEEDGVTVVLSNAPSSPYLIPSFVRVSYVSEENNKVAKWRMHGDFFHPAAWEICKDSFDMSWIPGSLSGSGGVTPVCLDDQNDCGQWWIYFAEEQMPTSPEVYANEVTPPLVQGGSNFVWMLTERQRREIVKVKVCVHAAGDDKSTKEKCGDFPRAVIPLGDLQSFLVNFTPNTALGKKRSSSRFPGYSRAEEREKDSEVVKERMQLKDQEDIEKALYDYAVYPSALFHKDATIKAARARDFVITGAKRDVDAVGPQKVKSAYYDVTITKPREATSAWCQAISRRGLCALYADYFRSSVDERCLEACGMRKNWSRIEKVSANEL